MIDLHVHSNASDGSNSPEELAELAIKCGLTAFALTDHDTVDGVPSAKEAALRLSKQGAFVEVISGVEISAGFRNSDIHILGLMIDETHPGLKKALWDLHEERERRNEKMAANLAAAGIDISIEKLQKETEGVITRAHFAKYLTAHGYVNSTKEAFTRYLSANGPYYVSRDYVTPEFAIQLIRRAGGFPILAHPLQYRLSGSELIRLIERLKIAGLTGIEAIYNSHSKKDEAFLRSLARKLELLITGGSDFHGTLKPDIKLGVGMGNLKIPDELLAQLKRLHT